MKRLKKRERSPAIERILIDDKGNVLDKCLVCLDALKPETGCLPCGHSQFCFDCISDWAQITNKCPVCYKRFVKIKKLDHSSIEVSDKDLPIPEPEDPFYIEIRCQICACDTDEANMLLCDKCDNGFHTTCLGIQALPQTDEWYCDDCILRSPRLRNLISSRRKRLRKTQ